MHDGSLGATAMHELGSWGKEPSFDNMAHTITVTLQEATLRFYTTHPAVGHDHVVFFFFFTNKLAAFSLEEDVNSFRRGITALRNARGRAQTQWNGIIVEVNQSHPAPFGLATAQSP